MSYRALERHFQRLGHLQHLSSILHWDEAVMMPRASGPKRAEATATLHVLMHEQLTDPRLADLVAAAGEAGGEPLTPVEAANLREIRRVVARAACLPAKLVEQSSEARMRSEQAWRQKRADNDFTGFAPLLTEVVVLTREIAQRTGDALGLSPYDALIDEYEPGARAVDIDRIFAELRAFLPALTEQVLARQAGEPVHTPRGPFPIAAQRALGETLMLAVGFDGERGRLDVSHHPFCGGAPSDVRITTRYDEADFTSALMGVLHETGHAKYEQGLPSAWTAQPVGAARGMAIHESQSLLQEMQVSRSRAFVAFLTPHVHAAFPEAARAQPEAFTADNLYRFGTRVRRGKIRVDADEVTYPSHVLIRYDLERRLVDGSLAVRDIPEAWDAGMREMLGIATGDDHRDGCLQDVHWPSGAFGYFPSYTLGALTAAQLFAAAERALPDLRADIARGDFAPLNTFLRDAVWSQASILPNAELLTHATGAPLSTRWFEAHLRRRYLGEEARGDGA
ncbi:MAG: carboxypeptidase M32 [Polyangiales bacterium]